MPTPSWGWQLPNRRGYFDRLLDGGGRHNGARPPRRIAWGPTLPASVAEDEPTADVTRPAVPPVAPPRHAFPPSKVGESASASWPEPTPLVSPGSHTISTEAGAHVVAEASPPPMPPPADAPAWRADKPWVALPASADPPTPRPQPGRHSSSSAPAAPPGAGPSGTAQYEAPLVPSTKNPPARPPDAAAFAATATSAWTALPAATRAAWERLSALSLPTPTAPRKPQTLKQHEQQNVSAPLPRPGHTHPAARFGPGPSATAMPPHSPSTTAAAPAPPTPHVHIGTIEVTTAAPPPSPAPIPLAATAPAPPTVSAAQAGRLSRPGATYGFGQG
ncbi:hypothetical protein [Mycobacterium sp.]|uniref:hypothetical protein n=1 Tax=Mycobacterium sp. TaxID=1785 RepID=UPI003F9BDCA0